MDVVLAAGDASWESAAIREIEGSGVLRLVRRCVDVADLLAIVDTGLASAALVSAELGGLDADAVHRLERGGIRVAAVESDEARCRSLGIERRLRLGSLDVATRDAPSTRPAPHEHRAPLVAVWGPAGAPGRSTVALGLASAAAAQGVDTVLLDADTYGGSQGQALSVLDDVSGLVAACRAANTGRVTEVVDHLLEIEAGLRLLTGLPRADMWPQVRTGALDLVLGRLRADAALLVADVGSALEAGTGSAAHRDQTTLQVLGEADAIIAVGRPDPVGLARLVRGLHDLSEVVPGRVPTLVVNMTRPSLGWREREVDATLQRLTGLVPTTYLPFDQQGLDLAAVSGRTPREAAPASPFVTRVEALARAIVSQVGTPGVLARSAS